VSKEKLLKDVRTKAKKYDVSIVLKRASLVYSEGEDLGCAGYFDSDKRILSVAAKCSEADWLGVLAHEASHMEQWIENEYMWNKLNCGYELFFRWLEGRTIVKLEILEEAVSDIIRLERDCELRAIKKIKEYNLPICVNTYSRKANAYLFAYLYFLEKRKWIPKIYSHESVYSKAPIRFRETYSSIPQRLYNQFKKTQTI
jgi:hypothetical protein